MIAPAHRDLIKLLARDAAAEHIKKNTRAKNKNDKGQAVAAPSR